MTTSKLLTPLFAVIAPFIVWPIEYFFPYPFIVEELAKAVLVRINKPTYTEAILAGFLFAFSESVFYLINILETGNFETYMLRLALTAPLHILTILIIKKNFQLGLPLAMTIHYFYNAFLNKF